MENIKVPFDSGNATIIPSDGKEFKIVITTNGVKYEFDSIPAGIKSVSIDGGKIKNYEK